jgi:hypothetical protein
VFGTYPQLFRFAFLVALPTVDQVDQPEALPARTRNWPPVIGVPEQSANRCEPAELDVRTGDAQSTPADRIKIAWNSYVVAPATADQEPRMEPPPDVAEFHSALIPPGAAGAGGATIEMESLAVALHGPCAFGPAHAALTK